MILRPRLVLLAIAAFISFAPLFSANADEHARATILVGSELDYPPYAMVSKTGDADGFSVDLMKAACEVMGISPTFRVGPWSEVRGALEKGEVDALPLVSYSADREKVFDFTAPHTVAYATAFVRKGGSDFSSEEDFKGKAIIVMTADATHDYLLGREIEDAEFIEVKTVAEALRLLSSGAHDLALAPRLVGLLTARELGLNNIETAGPLIDVYGRGYGFAVKEGDAALQALLNQGLAIVKNTGRYDAIYEKWFGVVDPKGVSRETVVRYSLMAGAAFVAVVMAIFIWNASLRRLVERRTSELESEISERKAAEEKFRSLLEKMPIAAALVDGAGTIYFRNGRFVELFGYTADDVRSVDDWWPRAYPDEEYRAKVMEAWTHAVRRSAEGGSEITPLEYKVACKDGVTREVEISGIVFGEELLATFIDHSERNRYQADLAKKTKSLERSNADLQQFAYVASHDLQEPLNLIEGYLNLLSAEYKGAMDEDADEFIGHTQDAAARMKGLIKALLSYSRVDSKGTNFEDADLGAVVAEVLENLKARIDDSGGRIETGSLPVVKADRTQIAQVLQNLVANALKFRDPNREPVIRVEADRQDGEWVIAVRDNGVGMVEEGRDRIFEIFHRLHARDAYPGTGIGLAICKRIVERHGGRIWVESTPGEGSAFFFTLPSAEG